jgi:hypothetical protein
MQGKVDERAPSSLSTIERPTNDILTISVFFNFSGREFRPHANRDRHHKRRQPFFRFLLSPHEVEIAE